MRVFCVSYDLKGPDRNYGPIHEEIRKSPGFLKHLDSTWLVATPEGVEQLADRLLGVLEDDDRLLVIEVVNRSQGWMPRDAWEWIDSHVPLPPR